MGIFTRTSAPAATPTRPTPDPAPLTADARSPRALPYGAPRTLTAAAVRLRVDDPKEIARWRDGARASAWQAEAWAYYDAIGEVKFAFSLLGAVTSRIRLFAAAVSDPSSQPVPVDKVVDLTPGLAQAAAAGLRRIYSTRGGQSDLLRDAAINLSVSGECYLVQTPEQRFPPPGTPESWDIRSTDEVVVDSRGAIALRARSTDKPTDYRALPEDAFVARIWRRHPRWSEEADSSMRGGVLGMCADLLLLQRTAVATAHSRLSAGALYLPDGLSASTAPLPGDPADSPAEEDEFEQELIDAMTTPISDPQSAAAVVPLVIRGPSDLGEKIKQFKFERSFDPVLAERADRLLERILQGIDVPKEIVSGLATAKYANAVHIDENLYKAHVEPLVLMICDALTTAYLRPYLVARGFTPQQARRVTIWYDPSEVVTRPDRAADANEGWDRHLLSATAWRRSHGFAEEDAPAPEEIAFRMLVEKGTILPELTEAMLNRFAPALMEAIRTQQQASAALPLPPEVAQALGAPPSRSAPAREPGAPV